MTAVEHHRSPRTTPSSTPVDAIGGIVETVRAAYASGVTRPLAWRVSTLRRLRALLVEREPELLAALAADLGKPAIEAWVTEIAFCLNEIDHTLAHLPGWTKAVRVATPVTFQPGSSRIVPEPLGVVCVIAPWNYPLQLLVAPLAAAVAAGNAVVAKPSELAPATADALESLLGALNEPAIATVLGGVPESTELLRQRFDHLFYTGNATVGRVVMRAAAEHLTPVTLELGGKSPAIVSRHAKLDVAAKRIAWGRFLNAGQTCIAPDHVLVEREVHDELVRLLVAAVAELYGPDPRSSPDYARIVSDAHVQRLQNLLGDGTTVCGGAVDEADRYIAPTILTGIGRGDACMAEEIFGPILPVLAVDSLADAVAIVNDGDTPLALYVFSERDAEVDQVVGGTSSGGVTVNGTLLHIANPNLPFGGVGPSGTGAYHGRTGFDRLSHRRAVHTRSTRLDPDLLYPPYTATKQKLLRRGMMLPDPREMPARLLASVRSRRTSRG